MLTERATALENAELERRLTEDRIDVTLPATRRSRPATCTWSPRPGARSRTSSSAGLLGRRGPRGRVRLLQLHRAQHPADHPARRCRTPSTSATTSSCARTPRRSRCARWRCRSRRSTSSCPARVYRRDTRRHHTPMFHQMEGLAVDEDITLGDLKGMLLDFARAMFGRDRGPAAPGLLPVHRAERRGRRLLLRCGGARPAPRGRPRPLCKGTGWIEILGSGMVDPNVYGFVADRATTPSASRASRSAWASTGSHAAPQGARPARVLRQRPPAPGAVRVRVPVAGWQGSYCDPGCWPPSSPTADDGRAEVERLDRSGSATLRPSWSGRSSTAEQHPTPTGSRSARSTTAARASPARSSAAPPTWPAGQTVAVALPGRVMPDGSRLGEAKLRGVQSSGMILAEDEVGLGEDHAGIMVLPDGSSAGRAARRPPADRRRRARARGQAQPARPLSVYGVAREVHAVTGRRWPRTRGARTPSRGAATAPTTTSRRYPTPRSACASRRACSRT